MKRCGREWNDIFGACDTHAYVNPTTFVTLKINARIIVGTESRFSLTIAMIRSPTQRTGKAYSAICSSMSGQVCVRMDHHQLQSSPRTFWETAFQRLYVLGEEHTCLPGVNRVRGLGWLWG